MKREILFRSAHYKKIDNTFYRFDLWGFVNDKNEYDEKCFKSPLSTSFTYRKCEEQYTGLKDKNGVKIFEGDILIGNDNKNIIVGWSQDYASFSLNQVGWLYSHFFGECVDNENIEVIGNIHENKKQSEK